MGVNLKCILCAIDFSRFSRLVLRHGTDLARRYGARLIIYHAISSHGDDLYGPDIPEIDQTPDRLRDRAEERIRRLMEGRSLDWTPIVRLGDAVDRLRPELERYRVDMVVAASYGLSGVRRLLLGTVVERMARAFFLPILVSRRSPEEEWKGADIRNIGVCCDLSDTSRKALLCALCLAGDLEARIELLHALEAPVDEEIVEPTRAPYEQVQSILQDRIRDRLRAVVPETAVLKNRIDIHILQGLPGESLCRHAAKHALDLIVVGVRRRKPLETFFKGSTTEALLRNAPCDVLVVPPETPGDLFLWPESGEAHEPHRRY